LQLARDCLANAHLVNPAGGSMGGRSIDQPHPDAVPIAILAAELYKHVEL
jgi:hypothetical protein